MVRIKLTAPEYVHFSSTIMVRVTDLNYGNHLGNDSLLSILHEARMQFLANYKYTELDLEGVSLIMGDVAIVFKSEGFHGNLLCFHMTAQDFTPKGFDIFYRIENETTGKILALAKTGMVCFNYKTRKVENVPVSFIEHFKMKE